MHQLASSASSVEQEHEQGVSGASFRGLSPMTALDTSSDLEMDEGRVGQSLLHDTICVLHDAFLGAQEAARCFDVMQTLPWQHQRV
eukprot:2443415-Alexandrium_andersonii.AAC.1